EITFPAISVIVTIVLLKDACTCTSPCGMCLRSFFLNVFFLPFLSGAAAPPAAAGFAIKPQVSGVRRQALGSRSFLRPDTYNLTTASYVFALAFFLLATVPLRGPLRARALVCVRCPRTGRSRRWRYPR